MLLVDEEDEVGGTELAVVAAASKCLKVMSLMFGWMPWQRHEQQATKMLKTHLFTPLLHPPPRELNGTFHQLQMLRHIAENRRKLRTSDGRREG